MLVKLGNIWVNPLRVSAVGLLEDTENVIVVVDDRNHMPQGITSDECASIINSSGQSYGGEDDAPKEV